MIELYIIGCIISAILSTLLWVFESVNSDIPFEYKYSSLTMLTLCSWVSVVWMLINKRNEILWSLWYISDGGK